MSHHSMIKTALWSSTGSLWILADVQICHPRARTTIPACALGWRMNGLVNSGAAVPFGGTRGPEEDI